MACRQQLQQRQRARRGDRAAQCLQLRIRPSNRRLASVSVASILAKRARASFRRQHQRHTERVGYRALGVQRRWIFRVVRHQQHRALIDRRPESGPPGDPPRSWHRRRTAHSTGAMRSRGDAPISRGHVVHGIGEARRRYLSRRRATTPGRFRGRSVRRRRKRRIRWRICAASTPALQVASAATAMASLTTRPVRRRSAGGSIDRIGSTVAAVRYGCRRDSTATACGQLLSPGPRTPTPPTICGHPHPARPKIRLQLVPPKPNELLSTR